MNKSVIMPHEITAENGSKDLMRGEFFENVEIKNQEYCGCGNCDYCNDFPDTPEYITMKVFVSWDTIKQIYRKLVKFHAK